MGSGIIGEKNECSEGETMKGVYIIYTLRILFFKAKCKQTSSFIRSATCVAQSFHLRLGLGLELGPGLG